VDALLGYVDVVNLCNNNFHMHRFQPRSRYSNLLEVPGFPIYPDTPEGMFLMNTDTYYRMLNWGLRLAAGAGSATGAKETPVGYNRAYVRCKENTSLEDYYEALKQGRNFVTNGPVIFLEVDDQYKPGDTIALDEHGGSVKAKVSVIADWPLTEVALIVNGDVMRFPVRHEQAYPVRMEFEKTMTIDHGAWIAARCRVRDDFLNDRELQAYRNTDVPWHQKPCRLRFAHTSPVYVTVNGEYAAVADSIREGLMMLDAFADYANRHAGDGHRDTIIKATADARRKLLEH
jgi:hypothetical protein